MPEKIVDSMNAWFGMQLRRELVKLMSDSTNTSGPSRSDSDAHSAIPQRLSIDDSDVRVRVYDEITWVRVEPELQVEEA